MATITIEVPDDMVKAVLDEFFLIYGNKPKPVFPKGQGILDNFTLAGAKTSDSSSLTGKTGETPPPDPKPAGELGKEHSGPQTPIPPANNQPPAFPAQEAPNGPAAGSNSPPPSCPIHHSPMRLGKGGKWFCPRRTGQGPRDFCKEKA